MFLRCTRSRLDSSAFATRAVNAGLGLMTLLALLVQAQPLGAQVVNDTHVCFPTCDESDGRFLIVPGGTGADTFTRNTIVVGLTAPSGATSFDVGIFDGDTNAQDASGARHWDQGAMPMTYEVFADPNGNAQVDAGESLAVSQSGSSMPDNAWYDLAIGTVPAAQAVDGTYRFTLVVKNPDETPFTWSAFKFRTPGTFRVAPQAFSFLAPLASADDARVLFPSFPDATQTTYDGTWEFHLDVPAGQTFLTIWDGDMDFGSSTCAERDTDDPDTPNIVPPFAQGTAVWSEGVAQVGDEGKSVMAPCVTGNPADDDFGAAGEYYRRSPAVTYEVIGPNGVRYTNQNPSGNREWEQFTITTEVPFDRNMADSQADVLPAGIYTVRMTGMDAGNVNACRFPFPLVGSPCPDGNCDICYESATGNPAVGASQTVRHNGDGTATIRTTFAKTFVDNTYGVNTIGWNRTHTFRDLVGSDHLQLALYDMGGVKRLEMKIDYITASAVPSGYQTLCVTGGEGRMLAGNAADVVGCRTSISENLNTFRYVLTTDSPATNATYAPNAASPNWIYEVWYEVTVKESAFGPGGLGRPEIASVHASPSKTGNNTEPVVKCAQAGGTTTQTAPGLRFLYTGQGRTVETQATASVSGDAKNAGSVYVVVRDYLNRKLIWFEGSVLLGATFDTAPGEVKPGAKTEILLYDRKGGKVLQKVTFQYSQQQPLSVGDRLGSLTLSALLP